MSNRKRVVKISATIPVSRELAIGYGLIEPTAEESSEEERRAALHTERHRRRMVTRANAMTVLREHDNAVIRAIVHLHKPTGWHEGDCQGCDYSGYEGDPPPWPCRTIDLAAKFAGINPEDLQ